MSKIYHVFIEFDDSFLSIGYFSKKGVANSVKKNGPSFSNGLNLFSTNLKIGIQKKINGINLCLVNMMRFLGINPINMMRL